MIKTIAKHANHVLELKSREKKKKWTRAWLSTCMRCEFYVWMVN